MLRTFRHDAIPTAVLPGPMEFGLIFVHLVAVFFWNFRSIDALDAIADLAIPMGLLPVVAVLGGRSSAFLVALPVVMFPIAGKTLRSIAPQLETGQGELVARSLALAVPMAVTTTLAAWAIDRCSLKFGRLGLTTSVWLFFALNFAFFEYPWPWSPPTFRSPSAAVFLVFSIALTILAVRTPPPRTREESPTSEGS